MIYRIDNFEFDDEEVVDIKKIQRCHPQGIEEEIIGVPLRFTIGYQVVYENVHRAFQGLTFYAPVGFNREEMDNLEYNGKPPDQLIYVLSCLDGTICPYGSGIAIRKGNDTVVYTNFEMIKTSGSVQKGEIIGKCKLVEMYGSYGWGVTLRGYHGGDPWIISDDLYNIHQIE